MLGININLKRDDNLFNDPEADVRTPIFKMKSKDPDLNGKPDLSNDDDP
jgi:hypothetical protein